MRSVLFSPLALAALLSFSPVLPAQGIMGGTSSPAAVNPLPPGYVRVAGGEMQELKLGGNSPIYPPIARAAHVSGSVVLLAAIGPDGTVQSLSVVSGPHMLQQAALDAVKTWTYKPYVLNGNPVGVTTTITVHFDLTPGPQIPPPATPEP